MPMVAFLILTVIARPLVSAGEIGLTVQKGEGTSELAVGAAFSSRAASASGRLLRFTRAP